MQGCICKVSLKRVNTLNLNYFLSLIKTHIVAAQNSNIYSNLLIKSYFLIYLNHI